VNHLIKAIEQIKGTETFDEVQGKLAQAFLIDSMQELVNRLEAAE
jgi:hypothetical protein